MSNKYICPICNKQMHPYHSTEVRYGKNKRLVRYICNLGHDTFFEKKITRKFLISELKRYYKEFNKTPTKKEILTNPDYPSLNHYRNEFKTWKNALNAANLKPNYHYGNMSKSESILLIKKYHFEYNKIPTIKNFTSNPNYPSYYTIIKNFNSWNELIIASGFIPDSHSPKKYKKYTRFELIEFLQNYFIIHHKIPTIKNLKHIKNSPPFSQFRKEFGTWTNALYISNLLN